MLLPSGLKLTVRVLVSFAVVRVLGMSGTTGLMGYLGMRGGIVNTSSTQSQEAVPRMVLLVLVLLWLKPLLSVFVTRTVTLAQPGLGSAGRAGRHSIGI